MARIVFTRRRVAAVGVVVSALSCAPFKAETRWLFSDATYSATSVSTPPLPTSDELDLQVFSSLELESVMAYRHPRKMAACLRAVGRDTAYLRGWGEKLTVAGTRWASIVATMDLKPECDDEGESAALVRFVVARIATTATEMALSESSTVDGGTAAVYSHVQPALNAVATLLDRTAEQEKATQDAPVLALSGGAANGAFSAGFLFELLSIRERALLQQKRDDTGKYRFSALVGTSVGALIAQILDLYFVDAKRPLTDAQSRFIRTTCEDYWDPAKRRHTCYEQGGVDTATSNDTACFGGWPASADSPEKIDFGLSGLDPATRATLFEQRSRQMCVLTTLYRYFTDDDEQTLMCVEPGPVTRAIGVLGVPDENLMRFDPMSTNVLAPVLDNFSEEIVTNDVPRIVVSVESEDNQIVGLDERVCRGLPSKPTQNPGARGRPRRLPGRSGHRLGGAPDLRAGSAPRRRRRDARRLLRDMVRWGASLGVSRVPGFADEPSGGRRRRRRPDARASRARHRHRPRPGPSEHAPRERFRRSPERRRTDVFAERSRRGDAGAADGDRSRPRAARHHE